MFYNVTDGNYYYYYLTRVTLLQKFPTNIGQRYVKTNYSTLKMISKTFQENYEMHNNTDTCTYGDKVLYIYTRF